MIAILLSKSSSYCVACMDAGEGREQGCGSLENLGNCSMRYSISCIHAVVANSLLLAAIFALYPKLLDSNLINQTYSDVP